MLSIYEDNALDMQDADIDVQFKNYSTATRKSLEAWSGSQLDLGLVNHLL